MLDDSVRTDSHERRGQLDDLRAGSHKARMVAKSPSREAAREAMSRVGLSQKAFAIAAGVNESIVSEALAGHRPFDADWPLRQDDPAFKAIYLEKLGLNQDSARSRVLALLSEAQRLIAEGVA